MGYHESYVVPEILGTDGTNDTSDRPKKRYKDYKRIITMKSLDTSVYREGLPYLVKFNGDPKGEGIDNHDGRIGILIEASGDNLTFAFVSGTFYHEAYNTKVVSISCDYLDKSKIEIIQYWSDTEVLKLIDAVKHNPDNFHGYKYWNEEIQILDQDEIEKEKIDEYFKITIGSGSYPLLFPNVNNAGQYDFNMDALQILENRDLTCLLHIKRKHLDEWETYGDFKIKVLHNPDGFQLFHNLKSDDKNLALLKDTWFSGDILSYIKGMRIEAVALEKDDTEDASDCNSTISHDAYRLEVDAFKCPSKHDEKLKTEIRHLTDRFEDKRFAIGSLLSMIIDIACGAAKKKCENCPLTEEECSEICAIMGDNLSDNEQRALPEHSDEWDQED